MKKNMDIGLKAILLASFQTMLCVCFLRCSSPEIPCESAADCPEGQTCDLVKESCIEKDVCDRFANCEGRCCGDDGCGMDRECPDSCPGTDICNPKTCLCKS